MKTLTIPNDDYYNICYNPKTDKTQIVKTQLDIFTSDDDLATSDDLICVFVITPVLIGMLKTLSIPFSKVKNLINKAVFKDIDQKKIFDKNSNLYNLLVNEFGLKNLKFN